MKTTVVKHSRAPRTCDKCGKILPTGSGYKYITPRLSFRGRGRKRVRCLTCPGWQEWEYSQRRTQPIMRLRATYAEDLVDVTPDTAQETLDAYADIVEEVADGAQESFDNMPEGLQQGDAGQRLEELADQLSMWADEVRGIDIPDADDSDYEHEQCATCDGEGRVECSSCHGSGVNLDAEGDIDEEKGPCPDCDGEGTPECPDCNGDGESDDLTDDGMTAWRDAFQSEVAAVLDSCPVEL